MKLPADVDMCFKFPGYPKEYNILEGLPVPINHKQQRLKVRQYELVWTNESFLQPPNVFGRLHAASPELCLIKTVPDGFRMLPDKSEAESSSVVEHLIASPSRESVNAIKTEYQRFSTGTLGPRPTIVASFVLS